MKIFFKNLESSPQKISLSPRKHPLSHPRSRIFPPRSPERSTPRGDPQRARTRSQAPPGLWEAGCPQARGRCGSAGSWAGLGGGVARGQPHLRTPGAARPARSAPRGHRPGHRSGAPTLDRAAADPLRSCSRIPDSRTRRHCRRSVCHRCSRAAAVAMKMHFCIPVSQQRLDPLGGRYVVRGGVRVRLG